MSNDTFRLAGRSTLRTFPQGMVEYYLSRGLTLFEIHRMHGDLALFKDTRQNLIVSSGKSLVCDILIDDEPLGLTYHAIGTSDTVPAVGDVSLTAEVSRKTWASKSRLGNTASFGAFYLASESTFNVKECGVFGGSLATATPGSGALFSHYLQSYNNSGGTVDLTFEYELTVG